MNVLDAHRTLQGSLRQLKSLARSKCLTDREFDRLTGKMETALADIMGPDTTPPETPTFHVVNGGRN